MEGGVSADEVEALKLLAPGGQHKLQLTHETEESLVAKEPIQRQLGVWVMTSRGHALVLRSESAKR